MAAANARLALSSAWSLINVRGMSERTSVVLRLNRNISGAVAVQFKGRWHRLLLPAETE
jgi:hypothetical protein